VDSRLAVNYLTVPLKYYALIRSLKVPPIDLTAYRDFLETAPDAMLVVDGDGLICLANSQVQKLFGLEIDELVGQTIEVLLPERLRQYHVAHRRAFTANPHPRAMGTGMDLWAQSSDGREFPVEISLSPIVSSEGPLVAAAIRDISARKQVETALRVAKEAAERANETKSRFLAAASHDLRQPLQALRMHLTALPDTDNEVDRLRTGQKMGQAIDGLTDILDTLLDIARLDMNQVQPETTRFALDHLLSDLVGNAEPLAAEKGLQLRRVQTRLRVTSDRGLLGRVVGNLIANAVRHTVNGRVLVGCRRQGDRVRIEVWDNGPGIPSEAHDAIFDEYVQLGNPGRIRKHGLGLGLSIVQRLAALLDHPVSLRSEPGRGSVFAVEVPIAASRNTEAESPEHQQALATTEGTKVLFIEDDPDVREATSLILKLKGYDVRAAGSGEEAYAAIADSDEAPDLILSDFRLPGRENGAQVVQRVRTLLDSEVPVVFMTGDTSEARIRETRMAYCDVLRKPIDGDKLLRALSDALTRPAGNA
jgi:PAS domain S-box-containing protein